MRTDSLTSCLLLALAAVAGCARSDEPPRRPLEAFQSATPAPAESVPAQPSPGAAAAQARPLPPAAQSALDEGNAAFRSHDYERALRAYRTGAAAAPDEAAPWFGVYLVAQQLGRPALADSALRAVRARSGDRLAGTDVQRLHAGGGDTGFVHPR